MASSFRKLSFHVLFDNRRILDKDELSACSHIADIKKAIERKMSYPASTQVLSHRAFLLADNMALDDLKAFI